MKRYKYKNKFIQKSVFDEKDKTVITYYELNRYLKKLIIYYDEIICESLNQLFNGVVLPGMAEQYT